MHYSRMLIGEQNSCSDLLVYSSPPCRTVSNTASVNPNTSLNVNVKIAVRLEKRREGKGVEREGGTRIAVSPSALFSLAFLFSLDLVLTVPFLASVAVDFEKLRAEQISRH